MPDQMKRAPCVGKARVRGLRPVDEGVRPQRNPQSRCCLGCCTRFLVAILSMGRARGKCWSGLTGQVIGVRDAQEGKGPRKGFQNRLGRCLETVATDAEGGCCLLPRKLAVAVRKSSWAVGWGSWRGGGGGAPPSRSNASQTLCDFQADRQAGNWTDGQTERQAGMFARRAPGACPVRNLCLKYLISSPKFILTLGSPPSRPH